MTKTKQQSGHMSNIEISMMLHFAAICQPYEGSCAGSPAYFAALHKLNNMGLIRSTTPDERRQGLPGYEWCATERGWAYVDALKAVTP